MTVRHSLEQAGVLLAVWCYNLEHQFHYSILAQRNCIHRYYSRNQNQAQLRSKHSQFSLIIFISCCLGLLCLNFIRDYNIYCESLRGLTVGRINPENLQAGQKEFGIL